MTREEEREEAIKTIQEFYYPILSRFWLDEKKDVLADALEMAIEALKKRPHGEWIDKHILMERLQEATAKSTRTDFSMGLLEAQRIVINMKEGDEK